MPKKNQTLVLKQCKGYGKTALCRIWQNSPLYEHAITLLLSGEFIPCHHLWKQQRGCKQGQDSIENPLFNMHLHCHCHVSEKIWPRVTQESHQNTAEQDRDHRYQPLWSFILKLQIKLKHNTKLVLTSNSLEFWDTFPKVSIFTMLTLGKVSQNPNK